MKTSQKAMLALEDWAVFEGGSFGCLGKKTGGSVKTVMAYPTVV